MKAIFMMLQERSLNKLNSGGVPMQLYGELVHKCNFFNSLFYYSAIKFVKSFVYGGKFPNPRIWTIYLSVLGLGNIAFEDMLYASFLVKDFEVHQDAFSATELTMIIIKNMMLAITFFDTPFLKFIR